MSEYRIALADAEHVPDLPAIERAAAGLFPDEDLPASRRGDTTPVATFRAARAAGRLWVALDASGKPVGFAMARLVDGTAHLQELDVHPEHGRRGLGTRLVGSVTAWARVSGLPSVTLTTFGHLAWNAPFYERLGFRMLSESDLGPELAAILRKEAADGLRRRVAMRREERA